MEIAFEKEELKEMKLLTYGPAIEEIEPLTFEDLELIKPGGVFLAYDEDEEYADVFMLHEDMAINLSKAGLYASLPLISIYKYNDKRWELIKDCVDLADVIEAEQVEKGDLIQIRTCGKFGIRPRVLRHYAGDYDPKGIFMIIGKDPQEFAVAIHDAEEDDDDTSLDDCDDYLTTIPASAMLCFLTNYADKTDLLLHLYPEITEENDADEKIQMMETLNPEVFKKSSETAEAQA